MIGIYYAELAPENAKLHQQLQDSMRSHVETHIAYRKHSSNLRTANENLLAQIDELEDELDNAYNTIGMYEEQEDRELDELLDEALDELFPEELNER